MITPLITLFAIVGLLQRRGLRIFTETPLAKLVSALGLIYLLQTFNPLQGGLSVGLSGALFILVPVAWFYFGNAVNPEFARRALTLIVVLALITSLYGLYHLAYGFPSFEQYWIDHADAYESISVGKIKRALATFSSAEEWGRYIEVGAIIAFGFGASTAGYLRRTGWFFCGAALSVMLLFTGQRTAIFGLILGVVMLIALGAKTWGGVLARLGMVLAPVLLIGFLVQAPTNDDVLGRSEDERFGTVLSHTTRGALSPTQEDSLQERIKIWTFLATEIVPQNPLGMGLGATSLAVSRTDKDSALPPIDSYFISSVITCGFPAALLFLLILGRATLTSWREFRKARAGSGVAPVWRVVAGLMPVLILNSLFGNTFTLYSVAPVGWLLVGWISAQELRNAQSEASLKTKVLMHSILVYHTISSPPKALPGDIDISPQRFERQLEWLSRWRNVVRLYQTLRIPASHRLVSITFDDGFRDNLTVALPLLEKFNLPMTLFVTAGFVGKDGYLSRDELREMSKHPLITIGAHGLRHRHFNQLTRKEARFELSESRRILEEITRNRVELMAWPYGECTDWLEDLSEDCGYRASWSVWKGNNTRHSLWRVPLGRRDNLPRFIAKVSGAYFPMKALEKKIGDFKNIMPRLSTARAASKLRGRTNK